MEKVPESYRPKSVQLKSVEIFQPPIDQCLAGFDILNSMPSFVPYQNTSIKNPKFYWSSLSYLTDNGNEYGNMTIRQSSGWGNFAYQLNEHQITRRLFVGSHAGGDSAKNFIERFWPKVYKPLVGLSFPDEAESMSG